MKMILHDLSQQEFEALYPSVDANTTVISDDGAIRHCVGCFGCWIKTPGVCMLKDGYQGMGELLSKCDEAVIISQCVYGTFGPFVKNVVDRSIPYILPYFVMTNGTMRHKKRYKNTFDLTVHFYGDVTEKEKETAKRFVEAMCVDFHCGKHNVYFHEDVPAEGVTK